MYTYQDLLLVREIESERMDFVRRVIQSHKSTGLYKTARVADEYRAQRNTTITQYRKLLYTVSGQAVPDNYSANYKLASNFFNRFITQENQFLLGNGVTWTQDETKAKLGDDFDTQLQKAGKYALSGGVAFGFWNLNRLDVFPVTEFAPLFDEEDGAIKAGVRFWQIDDYKPLRATLYEMDGYTEYIWRKGEQGQVLYEKRPYVLDVISTEADGQEIYAGQNYPTFPIAPLWANDCKQSELVGMRENIDAYDLIKSGFCNTVDEASMVYWTINNAGGMDDVDLANFVQKMRTLHATIVDEDGATAESHMIETPYASREAILERIEKDLYKDAMALNTDTIASGATTATQIRASYEPLNSKADDFEYQVREFVSGVLNVAGIVDSPVFTRSYLINVAEEINTVVASANYLDDDYITQKILTILGDADKAEEVLKAMDENSMDRFMGTEDNAEGDVNG